MCAVGAVVVVVVVVDVVPFVETVSLMPFLTSHSPLVLALETLLAVVLCRGRCEQRWMEGGHTH